MPVSRDFCAAAGRTAESKRTSPVPVSQERKQPYFDTDYVYKHPGQVSDRFQVPRDNV